MNEVYTVDELALCRDQQDINSEVMTRIMAGDIISYGGEFVCLSSVLKDLGDDFTRKLMSNALDSQNPVQDDIRKVIYSKAVSMGLIAANSLDKPF